MRCPKCGYNSFDHLDSCKKCGKDLAEHKQRFGIVSVLLPGQVASLGAAVSEADESIVDEAVAVAASVAPDAAVEEQAFSGDADTSDSSSESDDFGFDFMGDSEEEEDLSFDELFEEAPADEDVEETLPSPDRGAEASGDDEFSFDVDSDNETAAEDDGLEDDFGFDPGAGIEEPVEDDLSFEPDTVSFADDEGAEEDPKDPFDLPEPLQDEEAPGSDAPALFTLDSATEVVEIEENDLLAGEVRFGAVAASSSLDDLVVTGEDDLENDFFPPQQPVEELFQEEEVLEPGVSDEELVAAVATDDIGADEVEGVEPADPVDIDPFLPATGSRVVAFACDLLLLFLVAGSFVIAAEAAISPTGGLLPTMEGLLALSIPYFLVLFSLAFGYFTLFHFLAGQTPGKMLAGLRVESADGGPLLFSQAFLRSVGGLLQLLPVGLGYLAILASAERRGWNDRLAGTRLISLKAATEEV